MTKKKQDTQKPTGKRGGKRAGSGRKPSEYTTLQRFIRQDHVDDALKSWALLLTVRDDPKQKIELRVDVAKYILNQVIGLPKQAVEVEGEMRAVLVGKSEWTP